MKKLFMILAVMALTAGAAMAKDNKKEKACCNDCEKTEQCQKQKDCKKGDCKNPDCKKQCDKACDAQGACEFEGLNLTDAQKEQIKAIKAEQKAKCQADREAAKAKKEACKAGRQEARKAYLEKVKTVLTPEQYVKYLENQATRAHKAPKAMNKRFNKNGHRRVAAHAPQAVKAAEIQPAQSK